MPDTEKKTIKNLLSSETLIIAGSPVLAYLFSFRYEAGFAGAFKIPLNLIEVNITTIFVVFMTIFSVIVLLIFIFNPIYMLVVAHFKEKELIRRRIVALVPLFLWFLAELKLFGTLSITMIAPLIALTMVTSFLFLSPLFAYRSGRSYLEKLKASNEHEPQEDLFSAAIKRLGLKNFYYLFLLFILFYVMQSAGMAKATREKEFFVLTSSPNTVVLRIYGDKII